MDYPSILSASYAKVKTMVQYRPLDTSRNEIRVIHLHPAASQGNVTSDTIECTLQHVSLDDYTDAYETFLKLDGDKKSPVYRALLWDLVTTRSAAVEQLWKNAPPGSLINLATAGFSSSPAYQQSMFRGATTYRWGDFFALSYEWGDPNDTDEIIVNGETAVVTRNLKEAMRRLSVWWRQQNRDEPVSLWVDALCINQADIPERNEQVRNMRQIYSTAIKVLMMTGPDVEDPQATSELLGKVSATMFNPNVSPEEVMLMLNEDCAGWKGVCEIAGRSYWGRLWIMQEVLLANTGAWLCYGGKFCLARVFFEAVTIILRNIHYARQALAEASDGESEEWIPHVGKMESFLDLERPKHEGLSHPDLLILLDATRTAKQFDPRDKIYGILGMVDDRIRVVPDYGLSLAEIYRNFVVDVIKATGSLRIIYQRAANRMMAGRSWPSWVPDWSAPTTADVSESLAASAYLNANAAGDSLHVYRDTGTPELLHCEGVMIDTVSQLACSGTPDADHDAHDLASLPTPSQEEPTSPYRDSKAVREAFWNALTIHRSAVKGDAALDYLHNMPYFDGRAARISFLHVIDRFQRCNRDLRVAGQSLSSHFPAFSEAFSAYSELPRGLESMATLVHLMNPMIHRRFMVTRAGRLGMVPRTAQLGDNIFVLKGCNAPLILRRAGNGAYCVVGECYVDGVMNGEVMRGVEAGRYQTKDIVLC